MKGKSLKRRYTTCFKMVLFGSLQVHARRRLFWWGRKVTPVVFCVDYRKLNKVTKKDTCPLPRLMTPLIPWKVSNFFIPWHEVWYWQSKVDHRDRKNTICYASWTVQIPSNALWILQCHFRLRTNDWRCSETAEVDILSLLSWQHLCIWKEFSGAKHPSSGTRLGMSWRGRIGA